MPDPLPFSEPEMIALAASGVTKIDLMGSRGASLVTTDELVAMACIVAASGLIPPIPERTAPSNPNFKAQG